MYDYVSNNGIRFDSFLLVPTTPSKLFKYYFWLLSRLTSFNHLRRKPDTSDERIVHCLQELKAMEGKIPCIVALYVGKNFTDRSDGYSHVLNVILREPGDIKVYSEHPEHQKVLTECIKPIVESVRAVDFVDSTF